MIENKNDLIKNILELEIGKSEIGKVYKQGNEHFICKKAYDKCKGCCFLYKKFTPECNECWGKGYIYQKLDYFEVLFNDQIIERE